MVDIVSILIDVLKIQCYNLSNPAWCSASPAEAMFYLVLFPTAFILLLIYIITNFIFKGEGAGPRGLRLLISITIYAFIVMQGYYTLFVSLSNFWWILVIFLIGIWALVRHFAGGGGGAPSKGSLGGFLAKVAEAPRQAIEKKMIEPVLYKYVKAIQGEPGEEKRAKSALNALDKAVNDWKTQPKGTEAQTRMFWTCMHLADMPVYNAIRSFEEKHGTAEAKKYWEKRDEYYNKLKK